MIHRSLQYRRRLVLAGALVTLIELVVVGIPIEFFFFVDANQERQLLSVGPPVFLVGWLVWLLLLRMWRAPIDRAIAIRSEGRPLDELAMRAAERALLRFPRRAAWLRVGIGVGIAAGLSGTITLSSGFPVGGAIAIVAIALLHGAMVQVLRAIFYARILDRLREQLQPDLDPIIAFRDRYFGRFTRAALATNAAGITAAAAFTYYFLPLNLEQYVRLETYFPITGALQVIALFITARRLFRPLRVFLAVATSSDPSQRPRRDDPRAIDAYRAAQALPFQLALATLIIAVAGEALLLVQSPLLFTIDLENAVLMCGAGLPITVGASIYELLWHRATARPLLAHLAIRHRPSPDTVRMPMSLRAKMFIAFGGLTLFACGLALFWSFVQYKSLATTFIQRQTEVRLGALLTDLRTQADSLERELTSAEIMAAIRDTARGPDARQHKAIFYYLPSERSNHTIAFASEGSNPPSLPWFGEQLMRRRDRGQMELTGLQLTGTYARIRDADRNELGSIAIVYPGYRGRGLSVDSQIVVLLFFFLVLGVTSMGIVVLTANDLTAPIGLLERRAGSMAKGELSDPVISVGEADEVGRLTFAFEEMRRALNEKLRSSTEINLSLEQEVTRRTTEIERRNHELKGALDALQRAQAELVRSEKMASMGRLVAGIAHEINNPVNAMVNTASPLEATLEELMGKMRRAEERGDVTALADELREMLRVIQSGARRTKEIVQALHNYSRGDDDRLVDVDLHRGIDESLDLLRHHLRNHVTVERSYGEVGRVRGYAGQLSQVFMNLLANAAQALGETERGGTIRIGTERHDDEVIITVADDGPGIPSELLPRIFDPFFTTKEVGKGSGLGLSIVHGIVERHSGTITVESEVGRGTTFTVRLPANLERMVATTPATASTLRS